ncbi:MAG: hypothetical protein H6697_07425 [Myxococcales bacterium]|nr:hypothetical protein [Myxococcales bacterium]MCB9520388.1 hypothetical protein [Myxococcales bacterium]
MRDPDSGPVLDSLSGLDRALRSTGRPYMFIGGLAVAARGFARPTVDIDATVWCPRGDWREFLGALTSHGFAPRDAAFELLADAARVLLLRHEEYDVPVDISLAALPFEQDALSRATLVNFLGAELRVIDVCDLILHKAAAMRPADQADIEALARVHAATINVDALVAGFVPLADALEAPERVDQLRTLLERGRSQ